MKHTIFFLLTLALCWGCISDREPDARSKVTVELTVRPDPMTTTTRTTDEAAIRDLNFYLIDRKGAVVLYRYLTATTLRFECLPGDYLVRIAANVGRSLGETADLFQYKVTYQEHYNMLPMFCEQKTTISLSSDGVVQLPPITVKRVVSKISYNLTAKPADMELKSVQLISIPRTAVVFAPDGTAADNPDDYTDSPETTLTGQRAAGSYYMLPNRQGVNTSITDQKQKNADNAPACASWLLIRATRGSKVLAYSVYLGENNTSDFNVRANSHYTLNITLLNDNTADTRIASYTATVYDDFDDGNIGSYCVYDPDYSLHVDMVNENSSLAISGRLEVTQGDSDYFEFDRNDCNSSFEFEIYNPKGGNYFYLDYRPPIFTKDNSQLAYRVTLTDEYGFAQSYDFKHTMANVVYVHTSTGGSVTADKCLYAQTATEGSGKRTAALCHEDGCRLTATATGYYLFDGWYADAAYTRLLSSSESYTYIPRDLYADIYARFRAVDTPLDSKGTANCYIAPTLNTRYSFNATVQGNGKNTRNIWAQNLNGTSARMLWESDSKVVENVLYADNRISFSTGNARGNAVIGLFDVTDNCIWSWHIWSVDYDPATTAQTYVSGAVFMDRNLGAISTDCTHPASRGLYYQWGRKDPFIHPANCTSYEPERVVYTDGFAFNVSYPRNAGTESPYDNMTVEWSIAHPTTFMSDAMYEDWEEWASVVDWLYNHHPNLWGNVTTSNNNISKVSYKSIYDPCPVGWKVPSPEDFVGIERVSQSSPYYVTIHYNGNRTTNIPIGGTFVETRFMNNGQLGRLYTNAPYYMHWGTSGCRYGDISCTSIIFSTGSVPSFIDTSDYYRYAANPIRCIRE